MKRWFVLGLFVLSLGWAVIQFPGLADRGSYGSIVLDLREDLTAAEVQAALATAETITHQAPRLNSEFSSGDRVYRLPITEMDPSRQRQILQALQKALGDKSEAIEPNYRYHAFAIPNDPDYAKQWNLRSVNVEGAWAETQGEGVTVAVLDTGVSAVPDLEQTHLLTGYNFVEDSNDAHDDVGHGTHVAGTIAQSTNNNYGVAGIAYKASLLPVKVLDDSGAGEVADIAEAIRWAVDRGARVLNLSLGGAGESHLMQEAIDYAWGKGAVIVAAAGNAGQESASYPARYPKVLGVGATGPAGDKADYSNYGAGVDLVAPGGAGDRDHGSASAGILQETIDPSTGQAIFASFQGTSMAAPHVAAVAALVQAEGIESPEQVIETLKQSARPVGEDPLNHFGAGQLDATAAVKLAAQGQITIKDFFRWLRDQGYLNPRFWIDGGAVALAPKLAMVLGSYLLAVVLRIYFPGWAFATGAIVGSSGFFWFRAVHLFDVPQAPLRWAGSSIAEWASSPIGDLNPLFASVLVPLALLLVLLRRPWGSHLAIGTAVGMAAGLGVAAAIDPGLIWLGSGWAARSFLAVNALLCAFLAQRAAQVVRQPQM